MPVARTNVGQQITQTVQIYPMMFIPKQITQFLIFQDFTDDFGRHYSADGQSCTGP
jgi:hypothetical protein